MKEIVSPAPAKRLSRHVAMKDELAKKVKGLIQRLVSEGSTLPVRQTSDGGYVSEPGRYARWKAEIITVNHLLGDNPWREQLLSRNLHNTTNYRDCCEAMGVL